MGSRLFACYNDGIINLLEKYFEMNKKQARDALDLYKRFLIRKGLYVSPDLYFILCASYGSGIKVADPAPGTGSCN